MADVATAPAPTGSKNGPLGPALVYPEFEVIPLKALPFAGLALIALVAVVLWGGFFALEFMHVVFGAAWTMIDLFMGFVIGPTLGRLPPQSRIDLTARLMPKMVVLIPVIVTITLVAGWQLGTELGTVDSSYINHDWMVASYIVVGIMAVIALGLLEPANIAVLIEMRKEHPDPVVIQRLMKRFIYTAGLTGIMQIATLAIMVKLATG